MQESTVRGCAVPGDVTGPGRDDGMPPCTIRLATHEEGTP